MAGNQEAVCGGARGLFLGNGGNYRAVAKGQPAHFGGLTLVPGMPGLLVHLPKRFLNPVPALPVKKRRCLGAFHFLLMSDTLDYFAFYGLPESFRPDEAMLKRLYYAKSRETHPDFHATTSPENQAEMLRQATLNTDAYRTLSNADQRMAYLLRRHGLLEEGKQEQLPPDFLMDMMDLNEQLMELEIEPETAAQAKVAAEAAAISETLDAGIEPVLAGYEQLPADHRPSALQQIRTYYLKKRYLLRIQQQVATFAARS
jgi:molecular chaperone HscB